MKEFLRPPWFHFFWFLAALALKAGFHLIDFACAGRNRPREKFNSIDFQLRTTRPMSVKPKCAYVRSAESGRRGQNRLSGKRTLSTYTKLRTHSNKIVNIWVDLTLCFYYLQAVGMDTEMKTTTIVITIIRIYLLSNSSWFSNLLKLC